MFPGPPGDRDSKQDRGSLGGLPKHKGELCGKHYRTEDRVKLCEAVVTPAGIYGCSAWALTGRMSQTLQVARRKILRYVFRVHHQKADSWVEYMRSCAHRVDELFFENGQLEWIKACRESKRKIVAQTPRKTSDGR